MNRREILRAIEAGTLDARKGMRMLQEESARAESDTETPRASSSGIVSYARPTWTPGDPQVTTPSDRHSFDGPVLVFEEGTDVSERLRKRLDEAHTPSVIRVRPGDAFEVVDATTFTVRPDRLADYHALFDALESASLPALVVHLWGRGHGVASGTDLDDALDRGPLSLLLLSRVLVARRLRSAPVLYVYDGSDGTPHQAAVGGFARAARREHPDLDCRAVDVRGGAEAVADAVVQEAPREAGLEVRYDAGTRQTRTFVPVDDVHSAEASFRERGVYVITGGLGALGRRIATLLAESAQARLVLAGRSALDDDGRAFLDMLTDRGADVAYVRADVAREDDAARLTDTARSRFGAVHGVIHAAGTLRDGFLVDKSAADARAVWAPKVQGAVWLDRHTADDALDCFVLFSSIASVAGSVGQVDYAYANAFLDHFAHWRADRVVEGRRSGTSLSINWPLWADGGMTVDATTKTWLRDTLGIDPLGTEAGLRAFREGLSLDVPQVVVLPGPAESVVPLLTPETRRTPSRATPDASDAVPLDDETRARLREKTERFLKELLADEIKLPVSRIRSDDPLEQYGIDSIMVTNMTREMEGSLGDLPMTLFFENQSLEELADYLVEHHTDALRDRFDVAPASTSTDATTDDFRGMDEDAASAPAVVTTSDPATPASTGAATPSNETADRADVPVAIVGVSGRYPGAETLDAFWENLRAGRDCVTEIPEDRWDHDRIFDAEPGTLGKSYTKWGGFLDDVDRFDPLFFNISPTDAARIDPQERLFLQTAWHTLEDAGYTRDALSDDAVGVYVGVMYGLYQLYSADNSAAADGPVYGSSYASIANRVSYFLDFTGPSLALDTMCSSSLTSLHLAVRSIQRGECDAALAGGVNLSVHPYKYQMLSQARFASTDGRCRAFGEGGDGYVPGEGVGAVLLKPLAQAEADGDHIYAVVRGTALNHGGRTNGYTVPNPAAQGAVITDALRDAGLSLSDLDYVEAHGTGTSLGDPIEITGLHRALGATDEFVEGDVGPIPIGSVKSNVGHLESAAGIAAITKVLLQMKHGELAPSLHAETLNPNIDFATTPFRVQRERSAWRVEGGKRRVAGVSSFGAGGANAHVILEAYAEPVEAGAPSAGATSAEGDPQVVVLSARTEERLEAQAKRMLAYLTGDSESDADARPAPSGADVAGPSMLEEVLADVAADVVGVDAADLMRDEPLVDQGFDRVAFARLADAVADRYDVDVPLAANAGVVTLADLAHTVHDRRESAAVSSPDPTPDETGGDAVRDVHLADLAFTLQVGREAMDERLAVVASSVSDVVTSLRAFVGGADAPDVYRGNARTDDTRTDLLVSGRAGRAFLQMLVDDRAYDRLAQLWVLGTDVDWATLHEVTPDRSTPPRRISLPHYPFARERCWVDETERYPGPSLHPLLDGNRSTLDQARFETLLTDRHSHLASDGDGPPTLPAFVLVEQLRAAGTLASDRPVTRLTNIRWGAPVTLTDESRTLTTALYPSGTTTQGIAMDAEVRSAPGDDAKDAVVHVQAHVEAGREIVRSPSPIDPQALRERLPTRVAADDWYAAGSPQASTPSDRRVVREVVLDADEALADLSLPASRREDAATSPDDTADALWLHPALLDGVVQVASALQTDGPAPHPLVPDRIGTVEIYGPLPDTVVVHATQRPAGRESTDNAPLNVVVATPDGAVRAHIDGLTLRSAEAVRPAMAQTPPQATAAHASPANRPTQTIQDRLIRDLQARAAEQIGIDPDRLDPSVELGDFGFESVAFVELADALEDTYGVEVTPAVFYEHGSLRALSAYLVDVYEDAVRAHYAEASTESSGASDPAPRPAPAQGDATPAPALTSLETSRASDRSRHTGGSREPIAVVGMSGTYPQADDLDAFWENVEAQRDCISEVPEERWDWRDFSTSDDEDECASRWGGFVPEIDTFDARFFNISPMEAEMMDPQQRVFLQTVWHAIEDAGYRASSFSGRRVGLFAGVQFNDYQNLLATQGEMNAQMGLGNEHAILVNRISYLLNLHGPSEPYNTACSSALVALHRAIRSLQSGESEAAIAGGISLMISPHTTLSGATLGVLSPDGRCKTLDSGANGYVRGEGAGALLLKPLRKARADRDHVYAVLRGTAVNHGGKASSLTAPNSEAQADLIVSAHREAGVDPDTLSYLELHGTGTKLGDPVEIEGIKRAFRTLSEDRPASSNGTDDEPHCGIGSVKTNVGHLEPVSGMAGVMKVILSMQNRTLPGMVHLDELNPYVSLDDSPFYVVDETQPWTPLEDAQGRSIPRRAGVSSFGFGGVNAHVVIEEPEAVPERPPAATPQLVVLSAKTEDRLVEYAQTLADALDGRVDAGTAPRLDDLAYTLQVGREAMPERLAVTVSSVETLRDRLASFARTDAADTPDVHRGTADTGTFERVGADDDASTASDGSLDAAPDRDLEAVAQRWVEGAAVDWDALHAPHAPHRVPLPTYPFAKTSYWAPAKPKPDGDVADGGLASRPAASSDGAPPAGADATGDGAAGANDADALQETLRNMFATELKADPDSLDPDTPFTTYGIDSIIGSVITQQLRSRYSDAIPLSAIYDYPTLSELTDFLVDDIGVDVGASGAVPDTPTPSVSDAASRLPDEIVPLNLNGSRPASFWVHGGPGYAAIYSNLSKHLGTEYPFYAFQARGVEGKSIPHDFEGMVSHYMDCIRQVQDEGPYVIGGYSYGGLVAFEMVRRFQEQGEEVAKLILFDTVPPTDQAFDIFFEEFGQEDDFMTIMMANEFAGAKRKGAAVITRDDLADVHSEFRVEHVARLVTERANIAMSSDEIYNYIRGCIKLNQYTEQTYYDYRPTQNPDADLLYLKAETFLSQSNWTGTGAIDIFTDYDYPAAWGRLTGSSDVVHIPSDHFNMLEMPALEQSTEAVRTVLDDIDATVDVPPVTPGVSPNDDA